MLIKINDDLFIDIDKILFMVKNHRDTDNENPWLLGLGERALCVSDEVVLPISKYLEERERCRSGDGRLSK